MMDRKQFAFYIHPILLLFIAIIISNFNVDFSRGVKLFIVLIISFISYNKIKEYTYFTLFLFLYLLFLTYYNNVLFEQAIQDSIRYFFPILAITYGYSIRKYKVKVLYLILLYIIVNDLYQIIYSFYNLLLNGEGDFMRLRGLTNYFDLFGFINLIGLIILTEFKLKIKYKKIIFSIFVFGVFMSFSYKIIFITFFYLLIRNYKTLYNIVYTIPFFLFYKEEIYRGFNIRVNRYLKNFDSTRSESYRIVFNNFKDFLFLGKGPGVFGGPASTKFKSSFYKDYNFNWYHSKNLATTDSYYPHLFVELGFVFSLIYLYYIFILPIKYSSDKKTTIILLLVIAINSIFTFSLNSLEYTFFSLLLVGLNMDNYKKNEKN